MEFEAHNDSRGLRLKLRQIINRHSISSVSLLMSAVQSEDMDQMVIVKLKRDIESQGEIQLAVQELSKLCSDATVRTVNGEEVTHLLGNKVESDDVSGSFLITECTGANPQSALNRLAYADWFLVGDGDRVTPQQAFIEKATIQSAGGRNGNKTARRHRILESRYS